MIVAELPFTLSCHPTLRLHHLFYFIRASLVPLRGIEPLCIAGGGHSGAFELAHRVVSLGAAVAAHARICHREILVRSTPHRSRVRPHTVVGIRTTHHHGHRVPARSIPQLPALDEIVDRTINLFTKHHTVSTLLFSKSHQDQLPQFPGLRLPKLMLHHRSRRSLSRFRHHAYFFFLEAKRNETELWVWLTIKKRRFEHTVKLGRESRAILALGDRARACCK